MKKFTIEIVNDHEMSGLTLVVEIGGLAGDDDQWIKDLADHVKDNLPGALSGWDNNTTHLNWIAIEDDSRGIPPNA